MRDQEKREKKKKTIYQSKELVSEREEERVFSWGLAADKKGLGGAGLGSSSDVEKVLWGGANLST